jgi:hypothetical protein
VADPFKIPGSFQPPSLEPTPDPETPENFRAGLSSQKEDLPFTQSPPASPSDTGSSTNTARLFPTMSTDPSSTSSSDSLKLCTKKVNDTNFLSWRYNMRNALGYKMLDGYIKEHTPA